MTAIPIAADQHGFKAPGTAFMVAGGLIGALGAYLFQLYGGRAIGSADFAPVSVLWTTFFIVATVLLLPMEQYVTREVASGRKALPHDLKPAFVMVLIGALAGGGFVFVTLDDLFRGDPQYIAQIVLLVVGYALLVMGKGVLAGSRHFAGVGWILVIESAARLFAGVVAIQLFASAVSLGWAMVVGPVAVLALGWWRHDRGNPDIPHSPAGGFLAGYAAGASSSQLLLAGAPLAVAIMGGSDELISIIFFTFTIYRAPLTLIFALQGRILPYLVGLADRSDEAQLKLIGRLIMIGGVVLAGLGGLVGWLVGPQILRLLLGAEFEPTATVAMFAAAGIMAAAAAQLASQVLVAEGRTTKLAWAWSGGLVVALVFLIALGDELGTRVAASFAAGEFIALGLMSFLAIRR